MYKMTHEDRIAYFMVCVEDVLKTVGPSCVAAMDKSLYTLHPGIYRSLGINRRRFAHYLRLYAPPNISKFKNGYRNIYYLEGQDLKGVRKNPVEDYEYSEYEIPDAE